MKRRQIDPKRATPVEGDALPTVKLAEVRDAEDEVLELLARLLIAPSKGVEQRAGLKDTGRNP